MLAGYHVKKIPYAPCRVCPNIDRIAERRGCRGKPAPEPVLEEDYGNKLIRYWNCPSLFIPKSIMQWHKIYKYYKDFPGASMSNIGNQNARFLQAYYVYEQYISEFEEEK